MNEMNRYSGSPRIPPVKAYFKTMANDHEKEREKLCLAGVIRFRLKATSKGHSMVTRIYNRVVAFRFC